MSMGLTMRKLCTEAQAFEHFWLNAPMSSFHINEWDSILSAVFSSDRSIVRDLAGAGPFRAEFACSSCACLGSHRVLRLPFSKLPVSVNVSVNGCLSLHVSFVMNL